LKIEKGKIDEGTRGARPIEKKNIHRIGRVIVRFAGIESRKLKISGFRLEIIFLQLVLFRSETYN